MLNIANAQIVKPIVQCGPGHSVECDGQELFALFNNIVDFAIAFVFILVVIAIIFGGFLILTSGGNQEKVTKGRKAITAAIVGTVIVLSAWLIVNTIITVFTNCSGHWNILGDFTCN